MRQRHAAIVVALLVALLGGCKVDVFTFSHPDAIPVDTPTDNAAPLELIVSTSAVDVNEGTQAAFTVALTTAPSGPLTITLTSSDDDKVLPTPATLTFDASDFAIAKTVTVSGREDVDVADEAETITISGSGLSSVIATVSVIDNDGLGILATPASGLEVTEGGATTVRVRLSAQPAGTTVVMVTSSDASVATVSQTLLNFTADNWNELQAVIVSGIDDDGVANTNAMIYLTSVGLGAVSVPLLVVDDDVLGIVPSTTNLGVLGEGGAASFEVTLSEMPPGDVVVTVISTDPDLVSSAPGSLAFNASNWYLPQTVSVSAPDDLDVADGAATIMLDATGLQTRNVAAAVDDDDTQVIVAFPVPLTVDEGASRDLNVRLAYEPETDVTLSVTSLDAAIATVASSTLTFTPANYDTYQIVGVAAPEDIDAAGEQTALRIESAAESLLTDIPVAVTDDDQLTIETDQTAVAVDEAGSVQFGVRLTAMPVTTMVVSVSSGDPTAISAIPSSLTFTSGTWNAFQMVTISGVQDLDLDPELVTVTLAASGLPAKTVDVTVTDDDMQAVLMSSPTISVNEDGMATVGVTLRYMPVASVNVAIASDDTAIATAAPATLTFTPSNFDTPQQITIGGVDDPDAADETTMITASATGATSGTVTVTVNDTDALGITTTETTLTIAEAATASFGLRLTAQPAGDTVVDLASSDVGAATVAPASLTFTTSDWNTVQSVTVTSLDDADAADETVTVTASSTGLTTRNVTVSVLDDETLELVTTVPSLSVVEGGSGTLGVRLSAQPIGNVVVSVSPSDPSAVGAAPATLTFTSANYATEQTITVTGVADVDDADEAASITLSASGIASQTVAISVTDDDMQAVVASTASAMLAENGSATVGFSLQYQPSANVVVTLAVADALIASSSATTLTFTPANYATAQQVQLTGVDDDDAADAMTTLTATAPGATSASVAIEVTDDDMLGIEVSTSAMTIVENVGGSFGVRLLAAPQAATTVMVASSDVTSATVDQTTLTFDASNWSTYQMVTVTGTADPDAASEAATMTVSSAGLTARTVNVTVTDDEVQDIVADASSVILAENGTGTFGVRLAAEPLANVTVTVSSADVGAVTVSPATLTFTPTNYAINQSVTLTGVADLDLAGESVTIQLQSTGLARSLTAEITDDDTQVVLVEQMQLTLTEGGSGMVGVRLGFVPADNVTVNLSSVSPSVAGVSAASLTFTPANYASYQQVTVSAPQDSDLASGSTTIDATAPNATAAAVAIAVTDDDMQAIQLDTAMLPVTEGGTASLGVTLAYAPSANVTVTLSSANPSIAWVSPATLTFTPANYASSQSVTINAPEDPNVAADATTITAMATGATSGTTLVEVADNDTQIVTVSAGSLNIVEGAAGSFGVTLGFEPSSEVTVTVSSASSAVATVSTTTLVFTPTNYASAQTVTVTGTQDADLVVNMTTVTASAPGATSGVVDVTAADNDVQVVQVSNPTVVVTEGSTTTFGVTLGFIPSGTVTVNLASADPSLASVSSPTLTFTPGTYNISQSVTVGGIQDVDLAPETTTITASTAGATSGQVTVNVTDNDTQAVVVSPTAVGVTEGAAGSFGVTLAFQPSANVTVALTSSDPNVATPSPPTLTFTPANYNASQSVSVTALHDADLVAGTASITASASMASSASVAVSITDDDTQVVQFSTSTLSVTEGGASMLGVRLGFVPTANVTVTVSSNNSAAATVSPSSVEFTPANYAAFQSVTITGVQDANTTTDTATISGTAAGATSASTTANVSDDDIQRAVVSPSALSLTEGGGSTFGVTLAFAPAANITISVSSGDTAVATVSPATLTFTPSNYSVSQTVTVTTVHDGDLAPESTTITAGGGGAENGTVIVDVTDDDMQSVQVSPGTVSMTEGGTSGFGVTLGFQPSTTVTVSLASADTSVATITPSTLTFTPANYNVSQSVDISAPQDLDLVANMTTINASSTGAIGAAVTVTVADNDTQVVQVAPGMLSLTEGTTDTVEVTLGFVPAANVTVSIASDNTAVAAITAGQTLTFTPSNYNMPQVVTVGAPHDLNLITNTANLSGTAPGAIAGGAAITVTDDDTQRVIMTTATTTIDEGQTQSIGAHLEFQPSSNVTVTLASSDATKLSLSASTLTFTPANYNVDQMFSITAEQDENLANASATITGSASGATSGQVVASITDDDVQVVIVSQTTLTVLEGATATYTVRLGFEPAANATVAVASGNSGVATAGPTGLTFTPSNYDTPQTVTVTAVEDIDLASNSTTITASSANAVAGVVTVTSNDNDTQQVVLGMAGISLTEGTSTSIGVRLAYVPSSNVTVTLSSNDAAVASATPSTVTFTPTSWNTSQSVTIAAPHDADLVAGAATITASAPGATAASLTVSVADDDTQRVVFSPTSMTLTEGGTGTLGVRLAFEPGSNVVVTLASGNTAVATSSAASLTFTPSNYATNQNVTIAAVHDNNLVTNTTSITGTATGASGASLAVTSNDDDSQDIDVTSSLSKIGEASSGAFSVRLSYQPTSNVSVSIASSNTTALQVSPSSLTFTPSNYSSNQSVIVSGVNDTDTVHETVTITISASGATNKTLSLQQRDNDLIQIAPSSQTICPADTGTISVVLARAPLESTTVGVTVISGNTVSVSPSGVVFTTTNWSTPRTITLTPTAGGSSTIRFSNSTQTSRTATATVMLVVGGC